MLQELVTHLFHLFRLQLVLVGCATPLDRCRPSMRRTLLGYKLRTMRLISEVGDGIQEGSAAAADSVFGARLASFSLHNGLELLRG